MRIYVHPNCGHQNWLDILYPYNAVSRFFGFPKYTIEKSQTKILDDYVAINTDTDNTDKANLEKSLQALSLALG